MYSVYDILSVWCTQCIVYSMYAELGVNPGQWHGEMERDDLPLCSAMMMELWMRKRNGGYRWESYARYAQI